MQEANQNMKGWGLYCRASLITPIKPKETKHIHKITEASCDSMN